MTPEQIQLQALRLRCLMLETAIKEANESLLVCEGVSLAYYVEKDTASFIKSIIDAAL